MIPWIIISLFGAGGLVAFVLLHLLWPRCHLYMYEYYQLTKKLKIRIPRKIGYVTASEGDVVDLTRMIWERKSVGQVRVKEDRQGWLRLYHLESGQDEQGGEIGYVSPDGRIFNPQGTQVYPQGAVVDVDGRRHWWDLFLRLHSPVILGSDRPFGKVVETGRLRARLPEKVSLLARGALALLLYFEQYPSTEETPRLSPYVMWDTALPAALFFSALWMIPAVPASVAQLSFLLAGYPGFLVKAFLVYFAIWMLLHALKKFMLSEDNDILIYLDLVNRNTGIKGWTIFGAILAGLGLLGSYLNQAALGVHGPLFLAALVGFVAAMRAPAGPWPIKPRNPVRDRGEEVPEGGGATGEVKKYEWEFDSFFGPISLSTSARFDAAEIARARESNPTRAGNPVDKKMAARDLVKEGEDAPQPRWISTFIGRRTEDSGLSPFDELQSVLAFVQEPNIHYALDEDCPEIGKPADYFRWPVETLYDTRGDCDCKAVLAAALMRNLGYPVLLLVSGKAGHAAIAVGGAPDLPDANLHFIERDGMKFYFCETTGKGWKIGQPSELASLMSIDQGAVVDLRE